MTNLILVILSAFLVIAADALIKLASNCSWNKLFYSPLMIACYVFYFVQIILAMMIFKSKGELAVYTNLFVVFYAILGVTFGCLMFNEKLTTTQVVGIVLAIAGAYLLYA